MKPTIRVNNISMSNGEHKHDFAHILFGDRGDVICELERETYKLKSSNALLLPSDCAHLYQGANTDSRLIVVDIPLNDPTLNAMTMEVGVNLKKMIAEEIIFDGVGDFSKNILGSITQHGKNWGQYHELVKQQTAILLMTDFLKNNFDNCISYDSFTPLKKEYINKIIDSRLSHPLSGQELAKILNMSVSSMTSKFSHSFEITPNKYIMRRRMEWAKYYIENNQYSLSRITYELGFSNQASFSRAFYNYYGFRPKDMKKSSAQQRT